MPYRIDFKQIATDVDIEAVAELVGLTVKRKGNDARCECLACKGGDRSLQIFPETNSFHCYKADVSGDCIALYAHVKGGGMYGAAKALQEQFCAARQPAQTAPQKEKGRDNGPAQSPKREAPFDPEAFAAKLAFTDEVEALGLDEDQAKALCVGVHRGKLYAAMRYASGAIACFQHVEDGKMILPRNILPDAAPNVFRFQKRA